MKSNCENEIQKKNITHHVKNYKKNYVEKKLSDTKVRKINNPNPQFKLTLTFFLQIFHFPFLHCTLAGF